MFRTIALMVAALATAAGAAGPADGQKAKPNSSSVFDPLKPIELEHWAELLGSEVPGPLGSPDIVTSDDEGQEESVSPQERSGEFQPVKPYYYLDISYLDKAIGTSVVVRDQFGNSTAPISEIFRGEVPGVDTYSTGENSQLMIIPTDGTFTVTFRTTSLPSAIAIELTAGTGKTATLAIRYQDLSLPPGVTAMLKITPQGAEDLRYDRDGNGTFETSVKPTVSVTGRLANDLEPPKITVSVSGSLVTLTARDGESGLRRLLYSLDGRHYQPYTAPFQIAPSQQTLYAYADDNVANRATLVYPLSATEKR